MDTSTTTFCRFSPLKTPDVKRKHKNKFNSPRKEISDTDSVVSVITRDVRKIARSVSDKLKENSEQSMMSSDDDIFISQSKSAFKQDKNKRQVSDEDSGSTNPLEGSTNSVDLSPKKRRKLEVNGSSPKKNAKKNTSVKLSEKSAMKSPGKSSKKRKDHDLSDSDSESVSLLAQKSQKKRTSSVSSELSSSDASEVGQKPSGKIAKSPEKTFRRKDSSSSVSDISSLDSDSDDKTAEIERQGKNKKLNTVQLNNMSDDSDFGTSKSKKKVKGMPSKNEPSAADGNNSKLREYKVPDGFEVDTSQKYLSKADLQGKQLWLITAPDDFDISSLHKKEIKMSGTSVVSAEVEESEKQYEVVTMPYTSQMSSYNSLELETSESEKLVIGSEIHGQVQIMDWIPAMPPVELVRPSPTKHRVPGNLKPTFKPFGCDSPTRQIDDESVSIHKSEKQSVSVHKSEKHKKKKKKEKK